MGAHRSAVLEPRDGGLRLPGGVAVEGGGLVASHDRVDGMLGDAGRFLADVVVAWKKRVIKFVSW